MSAWMNRCLNQGMALLDTPTRQPSGPRVGPTSSRCRSKAHPHGLCPAPEIPESASKALTQPSVLRVETAAARGHHHDRELAE